VQTYPDDCVQSIGDPNQWWVPNPEKKLGRGALLTCFVPHVDQTPYTFEPIGRTQATEHTRADVRVAPLKVDQPLRQTDLPVAAMPLHGNEVWAAYRAKRRPCLVVGEQSLTVDKALTTGMPRSSSAPTMLVAPYFGVDKDGTRAGFNAAFVDRIRHCEYPQFMWDKLPLDSAPRSGSILRLDQIQPIGCHHHSFKVAPHRLSDAAIAVLDGLIQWVIWGAIPENHDVLAFRALMRETFN
jgi:hypothetical protein